MGLKYYTLLSIILLAVIGAYATYALNGAYYEMSLFGYDLDMPIALWLIAPAFVLFLASVAHIVFYSVKNFLTKRLTKKDYDTLLAQIKYTLIGEDKGSEYKTEPFKVLGEVFKKLKYDPKSSDEKVGDSTLDDIFEILHKVNKGDFVDLKKFRLRSDNELLNQNRLNAIKDGKKSIQEVLKHCNSLENEAGAKAFEEFLKIGKYSEIKAYNFKLTNSMALAILRRFADEKQKFALTNTELKELLETNFSTEEYLEAAKILKKSVSPDLLLKFYDDIQSKNHNALYAYLYILFELRLIDKARDFLRNNDDNELEKFRILLFLRDNGKIVDTDFIV